MGLKNKTAVIFGGSGARKPLGSAEVTLVLSNPEVGGIRQLPLDTDSVQISRKVFPARFQGEEKQDDNYSQSHENLVPGEHISNGGEERRGFNQRKADDEGRPVFGKLSRKGCFVPHMEHAHLEKVVACKET